MKSSVLALALIVSSAGTCLAGDAETLRKQGFRYYHGEGVRQDNARAVALFERAAAAGDVISAANLAKMYEYGISVPQDEERAAEWYRRAAEMGDAMSQFNLSVMLYMGTGVPSDRVEAAKWWTLAMRDPAVAKRIRPSVESAESKLDAGQISEGRRRAAEWRPTR